MSTETRNVLAVPFQPPSMALFDLLAWMEQARRDLISVYRIDVQHEARLAATELTPLQIDRLLTRGRL